MTGTLQPASMRIRIFQSLENGARRFSNHWKTHRRLKIAGWSVLSAPLFFYAALVSIPFPVEKLQQYPAATVLTDRHGEPIRVQLGRDDLDCRPIYVPDPSHWIVQALVAAEDQRFWTHAGLDPVALARAVSQNVLAGRRISGASTISTQVIRLIEPRPRNILTKVCEAFRALQLERIATKEEILAQYLNRAPFGGNIVGIEAAARRYFGKSAEDLSLIEASLLAGLPQSPSRLRPDRHPQRAAKRQQHVLERMVACGYIDEATYREVAGKSVNVRPPSYPFKAPHFAAWAGAPVTEGAAIQIRTTLDPRLQQMAEETLRRQLENRDADFGAVVILDVANSAIRAWVGSPDFDSSEDGQVNAVTAPRSAGSTLKPFVYALAMDRGLMTPQTVLTDTPTRFKDYEPANFNPTFRGMVSMHDALVLSLNLPAIDVVRQVGQPVFHRTLQSLGLETIDKPVEHYGVGLVLGNGEVRLLDLANAYACLARGGTYVPVMAIEGSAPRTAKQIFSPEACWLVADMLSGDERAMDTTGHAADVRLPPMAWKTGTSAGQRDAWAIAYNPEYVIGVWIGNPDGSSSDELVGRLIATPVAWDLFRQLYPDNQGPLFVQPAGIRNRDVCAFSGRMPGPYCDNLTADWSIAEVTRHELCPAHRTKSPVEEIREVASKPVAPDLRIISPAGGSSFRLLDDMASSAQQLALEASGSGERVFWFVNDRLVAQAAPGAPSFWPLERGEHQIVCSTAGGRSDHVTIRVE